MNQERFQYMFESVEPAGSTRVLSVCKLAASTLLLAYCAGQILFLAADKTIFAGKDQYLAWWFFLAFYAMALMADASLVLATDRQSAFSKGSRGVIRQVRNIFLPALFPSPVLIIGALLSIIGLLASIISLMILVF